MRKKAVKKILEDLEIKSEKINLSPFLSELLAREYIGKGIIPEKYEDDAFHIAVASANDLDYLYLSITIDISTYLDMIKKIIDRNCIKL